MQALHHKLDVVLVQILPYNWSETDHNFCEDSPSSRIPPSTRMRISPSDPPLFFRSPAGATSLPNSGKFQPLSGSPQLPRCSLPIEYYFVTHRILFCYCRNNLLDQWMYARKWWRLFEIKNLKFCGRGTTQSHSGIEEGPLSTQHTRVSRFDHLGRSIPHAAVSEQFEHWSYLYRRSRHSSHFNSTDLVFVWTDAVRRSCGPTNTQRSARPTYFVLIGHNHGELGRFNESFSENFHEASMLAKVVTNCRFVTGNSISMLIFPYVIIYSMVTSQSI